MNKIRKDSYLELDKYPQLIFNINRLTNKNIDTEYIDEYRKYLMRSVTEGKINNKNEYAITLDEIKEISILYTFDPDDIENLIRELTCEEFLISNGDDIFCFNECCYDKNLVLEEKARLQNSEPEYNFEYIRSPWKLIETDDYYRIEGYSDIMQEDTQICMTQKNGTDDKFIKSEIEEFLNLPRYFEILIKSLKEIQDQELLHRVKNLINIIINYDNLESYEISSIDEYNEFLNNKKTNYLELLDVSGWLNISGAFDVVNKYTTVTTVFAHDINRTEIFGCISLVLNHILLEQLLIDIAHYLSNNHLLYIEIEKVIGEDILNDEE